MWDQIRVLTNQSLQIFVLLNFIEQLAEVRIDINLLFELLIDVIKGLKEGIVVILYEIFS